MRKLLMALLAALFLVGGSGAMIASAQDDATPEDEVAAEGTNPIDPQVGDTITYVDDRGDVVATATVTDFVRGWEDYDEYYEPERGYEYVAFTVTVESMIARGAVDVEEYDFSLQTAQGYYWSTSFVDGNTEPPMLEDTVSLAEGDSEEFTLVFQVLEGEELAHIFWAPDSGIFLTLAQLEGE